MLGTVRCIRPVPLSSHHHCRCNYHLSPVAMASYFGRTEIQKSAGPHTATVIFLHGLGDSGSGIAPIGQALTSSASSQLSHVKFVFPTAPIRPVTMNGGAQMPGNIHTYRQMASTLSIAMHADAHEEGASESYISVVAAWFDLDPRIIGSVDHEGIQSSVDYLGARSFPQDIASGPFDFCSWKGAACYSL